MCVVFYPSYGTIFSLFYAACLYMITLRYLHSIYDLDYNIACAQLEVAFGQESGAVNCIFLL